MKDALYLSKKKEIIMNIGENKGINKNKKNTTDDCLKDLDFINYVREFEKY